MKISILFSLCLMLSPLSQAFASVNVSNGVVTINVSGSDGQYYGSNGSSAGSANVTLSYTDATKTVVSITGTTSGRPATISETIAIQDLKGIRVYAVGGDGVRGEDGWRGTDGTNGSDGSDGSNGSDGCPPSSGGNGSDGSRGGDGGRGGDGSSGGNGGSGGHIKVSTSPDQSELLLYVSVSASAGSGGSGGSGGYGGSGGRGGRGGSAGRGGSNNCRDAEGKPVWGPDGSSGWSGHDGSNGSDGYAGSDGRDGYSGRSGSYSFDLTSASGTESFRKPFELKITATKFTDDDEDSILEPGERVFLTSLEVSNVGPMPSPAGQSIQFTFLSTSTLHSPTAMKATLNEIPPGGKQILTFKKGALPLQVPNQSSLIGKKAVAAGRLSINSVNLGYEVDSGMAIKWPVSLSAASSSASAQFEVASKPIVYTLKNVASRDLGPGGSQPLYIEVAWNSKTVPGSDVSIALADGRVFNLAQIARISDLKVPANNSATLPLTMLVRGSKNLSSASGNLVVSLRLQDSETQDLLQSLNTSVNLSLDLNAITWNQSLSFARSNIQCVFPNLPIPLQPIASMQITKVKGTNQVQIQMEVPGSADSSRSPVMNVSASKVYPYLQQFRGGWAPEAALEFMNKLVSPNAPKGVWSFKSCTNALPMSRIF